ncbi:hypothetical protein VCSRO104_3617 [Vibrio cholerae]|nr:hypothetical protein VCSRO104_3617 [Vibrio cholerae]
MKRRLINRRARLRNQWALKESRQHVQPNTKLDGHFAHK